mmetsp:Transcript_18698/g.39252  ORF Transcript_18698/g.39252 Transcript_18698/m.39252 type:complete len:287 (-) Transcript_18698:1516-2376(-)
MKRVSRTWMRRGSRGRDGDVDRDVDRDRDRSTDNDCDGGRIVESDFGNCPSPGCDDGETSSASTREEALGKSARSVPVLLLLVVVGQSHLELPQPHRSHRASHHIPRNILVLVPFSRRPRHSPRSREKSPRNETSESVVRGRSREPSSHFRERIVVVALSIRRFFEGRGRRKRSRRRRRPCGPPTRRRRGRRRHRRRRQRSRPRHRRGKFRRYSTATRSGSGFGSGSRRRRPRSRRHFARIVLDGTGGQHPPSRRLRRRERRRPLPFFSRPRQGRRPRWRPRWRPR